MPAEAVTLNRDDVLELLVEANKVADVVEALSGTCPTRLTGPQVEMASRIGEAILGPTEDGVGGETAGVGALWTGEDARRFFRELAGGNDDAR